MIKQEMGPAWVSMQCIPALCGATIWSCWMRGFSHLLGGSWGHNSIVSMTPVWESAFMAFFPHMVVITGNLRLLISISHAFFSSRKTLCIWSWHVVKWGSFLLFVHRIRYRCSSVPPIHHPHTLVNGIPLLPENKNRIKKGSQSGDRQFFPILFWPSAYVNSNWVPLLCYNFTQGCSLGGPA